MPPRDGETRVIEVRNKTSVRKIALLFGGCRDGISDQLMNIPTGFDLEEYYYMIDIDDWWGVKWLFSRIYPHSRRPLIRYTMPGCPNGARRPFHFWRSCDPCSRSYVERHRRAYPVKKLLVRVTLRYAAHRERGGYRYGYWRVERVEPLE